MTRHSRLTETRDLLSRAILCLTTVIRTVHGNPECPVDTDGTLFWALYNARAFNRWARVHLSDAARLMGMSGQMELGGLS